jgi:hypothetical protein
MIFTVDRFTGAYDKLGIERTSPEAAGKSPWRGIAELVLLYGLHVNADDVDNIVLKISSSRTFKSNTVCSLLWLANTGILSHHAKGMIKARPYAFARLPDARIIRPRQLKPFFSRKMVARIMVAGRICHHVHPRPYRSAVRMQAARRQTGRNELTKK